MMTKNVKDYTFPKMFYNKKNSDYIVVQNMAQVPDGYVTHPDLCDERRDVLLMDSEVQVAITVPPEPVKEVKKEVSVNDFAKTRKVAAPKTATPTPAAKTEVAEKAEKGGAPKVASTLKSLGIARKEAEEMLNEEKVKFDPKATDDELADMIEELLEDDNS